MVCRDFILPKPASYVFFYAFFNLRNLLYIIDKEYAAGEIHRPRISYFGVAEPLLELLQRDDLAVTFFLFFSGFLAPRIKLLVGDAPGLDPREALFVLLAVCLKNRVIGFHCIIR